MGSDNTVVVRFKGADEWVGNFQPGITKYWCATSHPYQRQVLVISGGAAYVVDPTIRAVVAQFGMVDSMIPLPYGILLEEVLWLGLLILPGFAGGPADYPGMASASCASMQMQSPEEAGGRPGVARQVHLAHSPADSREWGRKCREKRPSLEGENH